jgi:hypothetical protein
VIGPLYGPAQLAASIEAQLRTWLPSVLRELSEAHGLDLAEPEAFELVLTAEAVRHVDRTTIAVAVPGLTRTPAMGRDGLYDATYGVIVSVYTRPATGDYAGVLRAASGYAVAVRTALLQHRPVEVADLIWTAEDVIPVAGDALSTRTLGLAVVEFDALVPGVADERAGPLHPPVELVTPEGPLVTQTRVTAQPNT